MSTQLRYKKERQKFRFIIDHPRTKFFNSLNDICWNSKSHDVPTLMSPERGTKQIKEWLTGDRKGKWPGVCYG